MKLIQLFSAYTSFKVGDEPMADVTALSIDSRTAAPGQVFVALRGSQKDSHSFLREVCERGVVGVVVEDESQIPNNFRGGILCVPNSHRALMKLAARFYNSPAEALYCVGVTGTNGKTSTTYLIESILNHFGLKTGVMGTINHHFGNKVWPSELTTPDAITLQKRLRDFVALGAQAAAFEVSSHALQQDRATGIPFDAVVFTNLTRDHLDYHKDMEDYFKAKEKLFLDLPREYPDKTVDAIININDEWGKKLSLAPNVRRWTYGESQSDFQFQIHETTYAGTRFHLQTPRGVVDVTLPQPGRHNVYNAVAAFAVGIAAGASLQTCVEGCENFLGVPGRLERVINKHNIHIFVDYAHTDDALRSVLSILNAIRVQNKLHSKIYTIFGCGGDRDKGKRPLMAQAAIANSDVVYITSDNPRTEDPMSIIQDILVGVPKTLMNKQVFVEVDRREAIRKTIEMVKPNDVILIAGKGHEDYQIVGSKKHNFSDVQVAGEIISGL